MPRDPSTAETQPSTSVVTASAFFQEDDDTWRTVYVRAEAIDPHEVGLHINVGDTVTSALFDPVAAAELSEQLRAAARAAVAQASP